MESEALVEFGKPLERIKGANARKIIQTLRKIKKDLIIRVFFCFRNSKIWVFF